MTTNEQQLVAVLEEFGLEQLDQAIKPAVAAYMIANPNQTVQQVVAGVDGALKHQARHKIAWLVDFVWPFVSPTLDQMLTADAQAIKDAQVADAQAAAAQAAAAPARPRTIFQTGAAGSMGAAATRS